MKNQSKPKFELVQEEIHGTVRDALLDKVRKGVRKTIYQIMEEEIHFLCGKSHDRKNDSTHKRAGSEKGKIHLQGQQMKLKRPRVRKDGKEVKIEAYEALKDYEFLSADVMEMVIHGISTRNYSTVVKRWEDDLKLSKSSVSRAFKKASQKDLNDINDRDLSSDEIFAIMVDGIEFSGTHIIVAMGFTTSGKKQILGLIEGATENSILVKELFSNLLDRGLRLTDEILFVLDGAKALKSAVKSTFGKRALIQRCQIHKWRNVKSYLPKNLHAETKRRMDTAYGMKTFGDAIEILKNTAMWLSQYSDKAAGSLREGMEETLTVHRLEMPSILRTTFSNTNPIESMFNKISQKMNRVNNWNAKGQVARWSASSLLRHEKTFRTVKGYREIPLLLNKLKFICKQLDEGRSVA